jgi:hypothetical protein
VTASIADFKVDVELRKAIHDLPPFFRPSFTGHVPHHGDTNGLTEYYENMTLSLEIHAKVLTLHKPWMSKGYDDQR